MSWLPYVGYGAGAIVAAFGLWVFWCGLTGKADPTVHDKIVVMGFGFMAAVIGMVIALMTFAITQAWSFFS